MIATAPTTGLVYSPQSKQEAWHACPAYESGYGGAKFGGKSIAMLMESTRNLWHPGYRGIIFRRTYRHLMELIDRAYSWFPGLGGTWRGDDHVWVFRNGARILMAHCQFEQDKQAYQGHEYHFMGFDQLEEFTETQYSFLLGANRTGIAELEPYTRSTFNPGGIGHAWVKSRFIDHGTRDCAPWLAANEAGTDTFSRCFHFATIDDNPKGEAADPRYRSRLQNMPEDDRRALLYGDWDVFAGQVFKEFRRDQHIIAPIQLSPDWPRWRAVDYGVARPFVCLWFCQDPATQRIYVYRELSKAGVIPASKQAEMILDLTEEDISFTVADPAMWIRQADTGKSIAQIYYDAGLALNKASNDRLSGLSRVHDVLSMAKDGKPYLQVFSACTQLINNLPSLIYDRHHVEDVDTEGLDDEYDALRYGLMAAHWNVSIAEDGPEFENVTEWVDDDEDDDESGLLADFGFRGARSR